MNFFIRDGSSDQAPFRIEDETPTNTLCMKDDGNVGIGTWNPMEKLHVDGNMYLSRNMELGSSRQFKEDIRSLEPQEAMEALKALRPVKFHYKKDPEEESVGFIAEELPDLVATTSRKSLAPMDIVGVLTKVLQEQQKVAEKQQRVIQEQQEAISELYKKVLELQNKFYDKSMLAVIEVPGQLGW